MTEHFITLSTTEPNNNIGIVKLRHADVNSQAIVAQIVENGQPKSFEGLQPFFCLMAQEATGQGVSEESVVSFDAKNGTLKYVASDNALQMVGRNEAYFSFRKQEDGRWIEQFSTRTFHYIVEKSIYSQPFKDSNYWWTFKELYRIFNKYIEDGKNSWEQFVEANREILESIDPGGRLLAEVLDLNKIIYRKVPSGFNVVIEHDSEYQPDVKVTYYKNSIGTEANGFDTGPVFGGERIYNLASSLSYIRNKVNVELPSVYAMGGEVVNNGNELLLINGTEVMRFVIEGATIIKGYVEKVKPPTNLIVYDITSTSAKVSWENGGYYGR
ncbi:BppU family phage baseplate upper protein [Lactococcus cremoris]|uniref:BppU family phage baseplate upper protein n=1 Tax=Lactococcus lactis subsp. cremoris TaxID=1359 RepID=A0AA34TJW9_LACLC|nr:BppU family phage baseplate upper protein [Lactococcus cremoris]ARE23864.1 BppU family phage baseplate upper protein [Lactococcus cremoris]KZK50401.1 Phage upper baseplate protein [Lactococcus cremoris]KZK50700.1 Phage upper baseplate protein [Lactococcus cremoris]MCT4408692.1 phage baseplate upper protein [Lactococcus cremoris]MCT4421939.1 phage baseplate upper protein [Lactococcus cremoris]